MGSRKTNARYWSRRLGRDEAERLLAGGAPTDEGLERLHSAVRALGSLGAQEISDAEAQRFAAQAATLVPEEQDQRETRALATGRTHRPYARSRRRHVRPALAAAMIALAIMVSATAGVAYAADGAVPGDTLYGLDLALEGIGIGDGGLSERLNEAGRLVERGRAQEGLTHAGDAIAEVAADDEALMAAARSMWSAAEAAGQSEAMKSSEARDMLAGRLRWMASVEPTDAEFGQAADDLAGSLIRGGQGSGGPGPGQGQPAGDPDSTDSTDGEQDPIDPTEGVGIGPGSGSGSGQPR